MNFKNFRLKPALTIILMIMAILLNACTTTRRDGPPSYPVDVSKIGDAVPKAEPRSKYGNMPSYHVMGRTYHVMASSKNYEEQGIASWYGTKFHAQRTSSGERYDMLGMTAAHKTLPLPTYVQVTNLANGKKIIVKVNDRGPFESNRLIDLSYVAAKKLGVVGHGTAMVDVKAIDPRKPLSTQQDLYTHDFYLSRTNKPAQYAAAKPKVVHHAQGIYIQVGAFKSKQLAEHMKTRLASMSFTSVKILRSPDHRKLYLVQIGPIKNVALENHVTRRLKAAGLHSKRTLLNVPEFEA